MIRQRQQIQVAGENYELAPMITSRQVVVWTRLVKLLGPTLVQLLDGKSVADLMAMDLKDAGLGATVKEALGGLVARLGEGDVLEIVQEMLDKELFSHGNGQPLDFEDHFSGRLVHLGKVVAKALEVNFGDFFGGGKRKEPQDAAKPPAPARTRTTRK